MRKPSCCAYIALNCILLYLFCQCFYLGPLSLSLSRFSPPRDTPHRHPSCTSSFPSLRLLFPSSYGFSIFPPLSHTLYRSLSIVYSSLEPFSSPLSLAHTFSSQSGWKGASIATMKVLLPDAVPFGKVTFSCVASPSSTLRKG